MGQDSKICPRCGPVVRPFTPCCGACGAKLQLGKVFPPGTLLGQNRRYRIERPLREGGFGETYLAYDIQVERSCVVKHLIVDPAWSSIDQQKVRENFEREARLLAKLNHPGHNNIPEIFDYLAESYCLVLKYIESSDPKQQNLGRMLDRRIDPFPVETALRYVRDVCSALDYMHSRNPTPVLHRDIKPANILLDVTGKIWVVDFGLAKATPVQLSNANPEFTQAMGTPHFTPPEQWKGNAEPRSDVYALAATLQMLLTNKLPEPGLSVREINPDVSPEIDHLIQRGMALEVDHRPTARDFLAELEIALADLAVPAAREPALPYEVPEFVGREADLAYFKESLARKHLAIISGLAGVGKTALATVLVGQVADSSKIFWHSFKEHPDIYDLVRRLAEFLAWHRQMEVWRLVNSSRRSAEQALPNKDMLDRLFLMLRRQGYLLYLDDFQFIDTESDDRRKNDDVNYLTQRLRDEALAGNIKLIMTSWRVPPAFAEKVDFRRLEGLDADDIGQMLSKHNPLLSGDIVSRLHVITEGNAHLVRLAANAFDHDEPAALIEDLEKTGDFTTGNIATLLAERVDKILTKDQRAAMKALAVLEGSGRPDAIEAVLDTSNDVRAALRDLFNRNLLVFNRKTGGEYSMHGLYRTFYYDGLSETDCQTKHHNAGVYYETRTPNRLKAAQHFEWAKERTHAAQLATADIWTIINQGRAQVLRALLERFSQDQLSSEHWAALCTALGEVYVLLGEFEPARSRLEQALQIGADLEDAAASESKARIEAQARRYRLLALIDAHIGALDEAEANCRRGLALIVRLPLPNVEAARLYERLADVLMRRGDLDGAEQECLKGLAALPPEPALPHERVTLLQRIATLDGQRGDYKKASDALQRSLDSARRTRDLALIAKVLHNLGIYLRLDRQFDLARECLEESRRLKKLIGDIPEEIRTLIILGNLDGELGNYEPALLYYEEARNLSMRLTKPGTLASVLANIGMTHFELRVFDKGQEEYHLQAALENLQQARALFIELNQALDIVDCLFRLGDVALAQGQAQDAQSYGKDTLELAQKLKNDVYESCAWRVIGEVFVAQSHFLEAANALNMAWQKCVNNYYDQALIKLALARLWLACGDRALAALHIKEGLALAREQQSPYLIALLEQLAAENGLEV